MPIFSLRWTDPADQAVRAAAVRAESFAQLVRRLESHGIEAISVLESTDIQGWPKIVSVLAGFGAAFLFIASTLSVLAAICTLLLLACLSLGMDRLHKRRMTARVVVVQDDAFLDRLRSVSAPERGAIPNGWYALILPGIALLVFNAATILQSSDAVPRERVGSVVVAVCMCYTLALTPWMLATSGRRSRS
jgi:hypothetical protein